MADNVQAGDTVELKSGSPTMTVDSIGTEHQYSKVQGAWCSWFDQSGKPQSKWFPLTSLKKVAA